MRFYAGHNPWIDGHREHNTTLKINSGEHVEPSSAMYASTHLNTYNVFIVFFDLQCGTFDFRLFLQKTDWKLTNYLAPLHDYRVFKTLHLNTHSDRIVWPSICDIPTSLLYYDPHNIFPDTVLKAYRPKLLKTGGKHYE